VEHKAPLLLQAYYYVHLLHEIAMPGLLRRFCDNYQLELRVHTALVTLSWRVAHTGDSMHICSSCYCIVILFNGSPYNSY
jgi:hypothetical protein